MTQAERQVRRGPAAQVAVITGLLALIAGCGTSSSGDDTVSSAGGGDVLAAAYQATNGAHTARVQTRTTVSASAPGSSLNTANTADGVLDFAKGTRDITTSQATGGQSEVRVVGGALYIRLPTGITTGPGTKPWLKTVLPAGSLSGSTVGDPTQLLSLLRSSADKITKVGADTVRGARTTHYTVQLDLTKLQASSGPAAAPGTPSVYGLLRQLYGSNILPMDLWVDGQQRIARLQTVTPLVTGSSGALSAASPSPGVTPSPTASRPANGTVTSIEEFYDFGVPVDVEPPPADQVQAAPTPPAGLAPPPPATPPTPGPGLPTSAPPVASPPAPLPS